MESAMDINDAIYGRRAVREYTTEPVSEATIKSLIDAAIHAPSAVNAQPWSFIVVRDQKILARISQHAKAHVLATQAHSLPAHLHTNLADPQSEIFHGAPVLILIAAIAPGPWIVEDCALAAENLMLCAFAHRLGSCWIGFAQHWLNTPEGKAELDIPAEMVPVAPIIVGHPKRFPPPVLREAPRIRWVG
jgi:nitroreductase